MPNEQSLCRNTLLRTLNPDDYLLLRDDLETVSFKYSDILTEPDGRSAHVYFIESGVTSIVVRTACSRPVEVAVVGFEGLVGVPVILGVERGPHECVVQIPGIAHRVAAGRIREVLDESPTLRDTLLRYVQWLVIQCAETAASNAIHTIEERLARWLLMYLDRIDDEEVPLTHELMSTLLGVRRAGVTVALHRLEGEGMIRARRGRITILDRAKLALAANGSYGRAETAYRDLIGVPAPKVLIDEAPRLVQAELQPA